MKILIKSQYNHVKKNWQVVFKNDKGAWEVISNMSYGSKRTADAMVDWYIDSYPNKYTKHHD